MEQCSNRPETTSCFSNRTSNGFFKLVASAGIRCLAHNVFALTEANPGRFSSENAMTGSGWEAQLRKSSIVSPLTKC